MEECMIVCRLELAEHRALLDKIQLSENLATGDKNAVSIARATITIYVPPLPYPSDSCNKQIASSSPGQSPSLHTAQQQSTAATVVQPAVEVSSNVQSCTRQTLPSTVVTAGSTGSIGSTWSAAARHERGNSDGASVACSVEPSHTLVANNNNNNNYDDDNLKDNRELLRKIAENYRILNRRDVPKRPTNNCSIVSGRVIKRIVHKHGTEDDVLPKNMQGHKMTTSNVNDENSISSSTLNVAIDRARLGDRLNTLLDNGTLQPSTSTAVNNIDWHEQEDTARNSSDSSTSASDRSVASSSSLELYLMKRYEKCRAKGQFFDTYIMTRHQRELLQMQQDFAQVTEEEELPPAGHTRKPLYRIKTRMSSRMKKKQALLATFAKGSNNGESVKVSPTPTSSASSDSESSSAHSSKRKTSKHSERTASSQLDTESSLSSDTDKPNETAPGQSSEHSVPATATVQVKQKIRAVPSETLARYLAHMEQKQRNNLDSSVTTTNNKDEGTAISTGDGVSARGELHGEPLVTGDVGGGGRPVVIECSTQTHTNSDSGNSVSDGGGGGETAAVAVAATVQCNSGSASRDTTRKITRIQRKQRIGRRFFHHNTIPYIKPRKRVQLRKTFSASLINLVDKSIKISKHKGTSKMNNNGERSVTSKLRNARKAKTPQRKRVNGSQEGSSRQSIAVEDVQNDPGPGCSTSTSADTVIYKGYSICNKLNVNSTQDNGHQRDTANENTSPEYRVTQSDNTTFAVEIEPGEIRPVTEVKCVSSNEDNDSTTGQSMHNDRTVETNNVISNDSVQQFSGDEAHTTNAQPGRDTAQTATDMMIITDVRSIAPGSDDEVSSNASTIVLAQPQDGAGISVIPEYLLQSREPSNPAGNEPRYSIPAIAVPPPSSSNNNNSTGKSEQSQVQPSNDDERLLDINRRLHNAHQTPNNSTGARPAKLSAPVRPKRTYTRRQKQPTAIEEAIFHQYQQLQQQNQQQLAMCFGMHGQPCPPVRREMYELSPNGRNIVPIHQYQTRDCGSVPVTSSEPPSYQSTVNNMINPNIPRLPMAARQSMNPALDLRHLMNISMLPAPPPPPPLQPYPAHITNPMIHPPTNPLQHPVIPSSHVNPMLGTPILPTNIAPPAYSYPITIVPPSSLAAPRPGTVRGEDMYVIRPMNVLENQQYTVMGPRPPVPPPSAQTDSRASVQSPPKHITQHTVQSLVHSEPQQQVQQVQSTIERDAQTTSNHVVTQHTVESMIRTSGQNVVQSPPVQVAGRRFTVQAQVHPPPKQRAQQNHTLASTSTERVRVEHLAYSPIEDIVNKVVQSPTIPQDRVQSPAIPEDSVQSPVIPEDRVQSSTSEQNVTQPVAEDTVKSPAQCKLVTVIRSPSGTRVVKFVQPGTQGTVAKTSEVKAHSSTAVEASSAPVPATNDPDNEHIENQQVTTAESEETLTASDSETIALEEVNNNEAGQSSTVRNTSAHVEESEENNNDVVIPAAIPHVGTPRARPWVRSRPRVRRYWQPPSAVRFSRTVRVRRLVNRQNYNSRRIERSTPVISQQDTTTTKSDTEKCDLKNEQTTETSSVSNNILIPSTSSKDNADPCVDQTPDTMNVPVNFYSQTDEPPFYVSTVISQGIEALQLAQVYLETFQNNHDTMRDLQQSLRELIANVNVNNVHGEHTDSRISHTEHLLKQFLRNQRNIRTEFVIRPEVVTSHNGTQPSNKPRAIFTVQRFQEALEKLAILLTQLRDSAASEHVEQRTSEEQSSTVQRDTINSSSDHNEPVVNLQLPWSRTKNIVVDNSQPSTSRGVSTSNQSSGGEQVTTTLSPHDDVKYQYALGKLEERKLDNNKGTPHPSPAVNIREEKEIVTELLDNGVTIQCSIPVHTAADQNVKPDDENCNVSSVSQVLPTRDDTSTNNIPEVSSELHVHIPPSPQTNILSHQSPISGSAPGIVGPCCQICCSFAKHEEAKRNAQKQSTVTNNEQSPLITAHQEQQLSQPTQPTLTTASQHQSTSRPTEPTLTTVNQQQLQQSTTEPIEPTLITVNQQQFMSQPIELSLISANRQQQPISRPIEQQQPISQPIEMTLITANQQQQQQQQQSTSQSTQLTLINANQQQQQQQQQQLATAQPIQSSVTDTHAVSTCGRRSVKLSERMHIPCHIDLPPIFGTNDGHLQIIVPQPNLVINRPPILTTIDKMPLAIERGDNSSHLPAQPAIAHVEDVSVIPSASTSHTHLAATSERRTSDGECLLSSGACKTEEFQDARTQSSTSVSHSNKRHVTDTPSTDDGSKRARLDPSTSDTVTPAAAAVAGQSVPPADFMAAVNQRLDNTDSLIRTLINKKDRKHCTGTATAARDAELVSQSSATSLYSERTPSCSTSFIHRPPESQHYNPLLSHHHQRQRHHTPRLPPYNVPTYPRSIYSTQPGVRPQSYHPEQYVRQRGAATPFQQPSRLPSRYIAYPGLPLSASVPLHSQVQPFDYPLASVEDEHPRRRSEPLAPYIPLPRRSNMDLPMTPPPPPSSRFNHHEYRSRRSSHRNNLSARSTVQPGSAQPHQELFSEFINYVQRNNLNISNTNNNGTDTNTTMYPVVQMPPFPAEVLHGKQYNPLLCKYYQKPNKHALTKYTINYKSKQTNGKCCKQRTDYNNNIITSIGDKNTVIDHVQAKSYPHPFDHAHKKHLPQQIHEINSTRDTHCDTKKTYVPPGGNSDNNTKHPHDTAQSVVVDKQNNRQPVSAHKGAKQAIEMAAARLQVKHLNSFIENNRRTLLRDNGPYIRAETLRAYAVTDAREIHRLFDIVALRDSDQYYRSLWCMWSVSENKHLYEFYRTVTQLQIRAGQTPFAIRIFIELLRRKYFGSVRKLTEDQRKQ